MNSERKRRKKQQLRERDGDCCHWCCVYLYDWEMTLDHLIPVSYGGGNSNDNLVISCYRCNNRRGNSLGSPYYY